MQIPSCQVKHQTELSKEVEYHIHRELKDEVSCQLPLNP